MDEKIAKECLITSEGKKPSEVGEAVDVLHQKYRTYKAIAQQVDNVSETFLIVRHRIFQLPKGIQWKVDQGEIGIEHGYQISRLGNEDDQWLLALAIIEKKLMVEECNNVVNMISNQNVSIGEALSGSTGVRFDEPKPLLLMIRPDLWIPMSRAAWEQGMNWEDYCSQLIRRGIFFDIAQLENGFEALELFVREGRKQIKILKNL